MGMVGNLEAEESIKIIKGHDMVGESKSSWVVTCKWLLENNIKVHRVKSENDYSKRKRKKRKWKKNTYYLQDMKYFQIVGSKNKVVGLHINKYI